MENGVTIFKHKKSNKQNEHKDKRARSWPNNKKRKG